MITTGIIIPTYNARESIIDSIERIKKAVPNALLLIVDDNSPDNTSELVNKYFSKDKNIHLINRPNKDGRGSAILAGLRFLYRNKNIKYFVEMDADLCHNPKYIKELIYNCKSADVVIASRYLKASKIYGWNIKRKLMSFSINTFAKLMLQIPITDYTDGFRCYSRKAVAIISSNKVQSRGYIVLSETAYICYKNKLIFKEIPIDFYFKTITKSNLNSKEIKEALFTLVRLRFTKYEITKK